MNAFPTIRFRSAIALAALASVAVSAHAQSAPVPAPYPYSNPNPYYSYSPGSRMAGKADVIDAASNAILKQNTYWEGVEDRKLKQAQTRVQVRELEKYERSQEPTPDDIRNSRETAALNRALNNPPLEEVYSGDALNSIMMILITDERAGRHGQDMTLDPGLVKAMNVTASGLKQGDMGAIKGKDLDWPYTLEKFKEPLNTMIPKATASVVEGKPDKALFAQIDKEIVKLRDKLDELTAKTDMGPNDFVEASKFIKSLKSAMTELKSPTAAGHFNGSYKFKGDSVAELVGHMGKYSLQFAASTPGDGPSYVSLQRSLVAYYNSCHSATVKSKVAPPKMSP